MKKILSTLLIATAAYTANAQVAINTTGNSANTTAMLDVSSTNKGMLIPRIALTSNTDITTIPSPTNSLLIYNTATSGAGSNAVVPGFYYWNTPKWVQIATTPNTTATTWSLTGNAGLSENSNFIGTTDNKPLNFRVNNVQVAELSPIKGNLALGLRSMFGSQDGYSNIAIGSGALHYNVSESNLVAVGDSALYNSGLFISPTDHPTGNTAIGSKTLFANLIGFNNTALGTLALTNNESGYRNTAAGTYSLRDNISGYGNTATGYAALVKNGTGVYNTATGTNSLYTNELGHYNSAFGYSAALFATGNWNTSVGCYSLLNTTTGQANVTVGFQAMQYNTTGDNNTAIGTNAGPVSGFGTYSNSTAIGQTATYTASNQVRVGNTAVTAIGGYATFMNISDIRFKKNIQPETHGLDFILKLEPIVYNMDVRKLNKFIYGEGADTLFKGTAQTAINDKENILYTGFSAQQVEAAAKSINYNFSGVQKPQNEHDHYALGYSEFVVPLVKAVQEQQTMIENLQSTIKKMEERLTALEKK